MNNEQCAWTPHISEKGKVDLLFYSTDCGQPSVMACTKERRTWKHCPYCGKGLLVSQESFLDQEVA